MMVLGAGFGLGVALGVSRLFAGLAPGLTIAGLVAGGVVGLLLTVWVVGMRGLLNDRAVLDRWVSEVTGMLQSAVEERVATRVLAAEADADRRRGQTRRGRRRDRPRRRSGRSTPSCVNTRSRRRGPPRCGIGGCRRCRRHWTRCGRSWRAVRPQGR